MSKSWANEGPDTSAWLGSINTEKETVADIISCGNCGRRIQPSQKSVDVYNTRYKSYEHYHESYIGCYESTRPSGKVRLSHRYKPWMQNVFNDVFTPEPTHWTNLDQ